MSRTALVIISFLAGLLVVPAMMYIYILLGRLPVATADAPFPFEASIVKIPLRARIHREMPAASPIPVTDDNLIAGAEVYQHACAFCHGIRNAPSDIGRTMFPEVPQLWAMHKNGVVGVSDDSVGETYWKVKNGIRLSGMPAYAKILTDTQMWQVSLLLSKAAEPLPVAVTRIVAHTQ